LKKVLKDGGGIGRQPASKKKAGDVLRHPILTLKKVARLPSKDRVEVMKFLKNSEVMKALKHKIRKCKAPRERVIKSLEEVTPVPANDSCSLASVNKDWTHWVVLCGNEEVAAKDVQDIGKTIGVSFKDDTQNMFSVLSRSKENFHELVLMSVVGGDVEEGVV